MCVLNGGIGKMSKMGVVEAAQTECAAGIFLTPKMDGSLRFCVDYRKVKMVTIGDAYPIPRMDECI